MTDDKKPGDSDTQPEGADKNADKDNLNSVLASWDDPEDSSKKPTGDDATAVAPVAAESMGDTEYAKDKAIARVKGDLDVSDEFVLRYLLGLAGENEAFDNAFRERNIHRGRWDEALTAVASEFQNTMKARAGNDTADVVNDRGLAAAVHVAKATQATGGGLDDVDWGSLSDSDFERKKQEVYRLAEQGKL